MDKCENFARVYYHPGYNDITLIAKKTYFKIIDSIIETDIGKHVYIGITGEEQMPTINTEEFLREECVMIGTFECGKEWKEVGE